MYRGPRYWTQPEIFSEWLADLDRTTRTVEETPTTYVGERTFIIPLTTEIVFSDEEVTVKVS